MNEEICAVVTTVINYASYMNNLFLLGLLIQSDLVLFDFKAYRVE